MSYLEIILIATGLCFDTFAVSLVAGACMGKISSKYIIKIIISFALFQSGFAFMGWAVGSTISIYVEKIDHWVAFFLLVGIGGKMIFDSFKKENKECVNFLDVSKLLFASVVTSIDAFAIGLSFAMLHISKARVLWSFLIIAFITVIASFSGIRSGEYIGEKIGHRANIVGGIILITIGIKILTEHLAF